MYRNAYITALKINAMFTLVLCGLGIDVSIEKRQGDIRVALLVVSIVGTFVGGAATWLAAKVALSSRHVSTRWATCRGFDLPVCWCSVCSIALLPVPASGTVFRRIHSSEMHDS
jgi:hypothetical protein